MAQEGWISLRKADSGDRQAEGMTVFLPVPCLVALIWAADVRNSYLY